MSFKKTQIKDLLVFEPKLFPDARGYFYESYNQKLFAEAGINSVFVQDNQAASSYGVLRGLHYQIPPFAQAKLVRVVKGKVLDIAVDIREDSPTYGQWYSIILSARNHKQLFIPRGFAHGYVVLSKTAIFVYKTDSLYSKESEGGILFNDKTLNIDWQINMDKVIVSDRDIGLPAFGKHRRFRR